MSGPFPASTASRDGDFSGSGGCSLGTILSLQMPCAHCGKQHGASPGLEGNLPGPPGSRRCLGIPSTSWTRPLPR